MPKPPEGHVSQTGNGKVNLKAVDNCIIDPAQTSKRSNPMEADEKIANKRKQGPQDLDPPVTIEPSPAKHGKGQLPVTQYCVKKLSPAEYLRNIPSTCSPKNYILENPVQISVKDIGYGLWTAFQVDAFGSGKEATNIQPLYRVLGIDQRNAVQRSKKEQDIAAKLNILCVCKRRKSKDNGMPIYKKQRGKPDLRMEPESLFFLNWMTTSKEKKENKCKQLVQVRTTKLMVYEMSTQ